MIWLIAVPSAVWVAWGILNWGKWRKMRRGDETDAQGVAIILGSIILFFTILILSLIGLAHGVRLAKMQAFTDANTQNYEIAIDETASYLSADKFADKLVAGSLEKMEQAGYVSERIAEWRNAVNEYNMTIAKMQYYDRNIFTGILVPNEVQDMKLLIIE